ncbi:WD40-repeat-containing domain protein [Hygrophoropsis aurantiaca]|uniref:WD40-repeat-containing domain protein n=1 Tax=Hygrophoropsis aurantiaca TaxID=72124 RepID=A0ACB8ABV5_9AGAM|nr:WD40-repeat-containing domain protein [Hygrophoropsis aurantiaca]
MSTSISPELELEDPAPHPATKVFKGHTKRVVSVAYFKDGKRVISGSRDNTIRIWNVENGKEEGSMLHGSMVKSILISPNEKKLVIGGGGTTLWDLESRAVVWKTKEAAWGLAFSPNAQLIAAGGTHREIIVLLDVESGRRTREPLQVGESVQCLAFSPDGTRLAAGTRGGQVEVFDVTTGKRVVGPINAHTAVVVSLVFAIDGQQFLTASWDKSIQVWDSATGQEVGEPMLGHTSSIHEIALSGDGRHIASVSYDRTVCIWDLRTRQQTGDPLQAQDSVHSVAWSSDGLSIVVGDDKGNISLSSPPLPIVPRSRANSASSSILNLPIGPLPTPPRSPELDDGAAEENDWEYSTNESFDSVFDLPADGTRPAQRRKRKRRRAAPVASSSTPAPPISASTFIPSRRFNCINVLSFQVVRNAPPVIINAPRRSPLPPPPPDQTPSPPARPTADAHAPRKNRNEPLESQPVEPSPVPSAPADDIEMQPRPTQTISPSTELPADHAEAVTPKSRVSRLLTRSKRRPTSTTPGPENIEMRPPPSARRHRRAQNPPPRTRPRRQSQSEVVNVAAGRLDQRLAASSNKWTDKIDWLDYICFCMCCPWNKVISESDSEHQGNQTAAGAGGSSGSSESESARESPVNLTDIY